MAQGLMFLVATPRGGAAKKQGCTWSASILISVADIAATGEVRRVQKRAKGSDGKAAPERESFWHSLRGAGVILQH